LKAKARGSSVHDGPVSRSAAGQPIRGRRPQPGQAPDHGDPGGGTEREDRERTGPAPGLRPHRYELNGGDDRQEAERGLQGQRRPDRVLRRELGDEWWDARWIADGVAAKLGAALPFSPAP
jgi:hypothetical protein